MMPNRLTKTSYPALEKAREAQRASRESSSKKEKATSTETSGKGPSVSWARPLKAIRLTCLQCNGSSKMVKYCTADGIHSTRCELWAYHFGMRPGKAAAKHGDNFMRPKQMPAANVCVEDLE